VLFSQFGVKKVTTDEIARVAGVSKATVYRYYKNKHEIFLDVVKIETNAMLTAIKQAIDGETTVVGKLKAHLMMKMEKIYELINFYRVTQEIWGDHWPHVADVLEYSLEEEENLIRSILENGNRRNEVNVKDVDLVAHVIVVSFKSIEYPWALEGQNFSLSRVVDTMLDIFMNGLQKR